MTKPLSPAAQALLDEYSAAADFTFDPSIDFWGVKAGLAASLTAPTLLERAMAGDATAAKRFLHEAGFTDKQGQWLPQYQPIPEATND